jgi:ABC-type glycerol-3-phosphate transport system substrate-binding protein
MQTRLFSVVSAVVLLLVICTGVNAAKQQLEYYSMWNPGEDQQQVLAKVIADFEEANPGVSVKVTWAGRQVVAKARSRVIMGNPPDIIDQSFCELWGALLADKEVAVPVDDLLDSQGPEGQERFRDIFYAPTFDLYQVSDRSYFVPYEFITSGFFYDKATFSKYGLQEPKTWDELMDVAEKLKSQGIAPFAQDGNIAFYNAYWFYWLTNRILGPRSFYAAAADGTGETWDHPGYLQAAEMIYDLSKARNGYFQQGYDGSNYPAAQMGWARRESAMILCGTWIPNETAEGQATDFDIGYFAFPEAENGEGTLENFEAYMIGFAIPKGAKNEELAKEFIKFTLKKEYQEMIASQAQNIAARKDVNLPTVLADVDPYLRNATEFHMEYDGVQAKLPEWFTSIFYGLDDRLLFGNITPTEFIQQIKQQTIGYWQKKK